jgi:hypothetical protein
MDALSKYLELHLILQQNAQSYITKKSKNKSVATDIRAIFNAPNGNEAYVTIGTSRDTSEFACDSLRH